MSELNGADVQDRYAEAVVEARLGRHARDVLEATIVLEAWTGAPARNAMASARGLVGADASAPRVRGQVEPTNDEQQKGIVAEGITLILSIISVAAWATPLSKDFGAHFLADAIRVALPIAIGMQWALRSRYLSRRDGFALLAADGLLCCWLLIWAVELPLALFMPGWGPIAALLVPIWVGGTLLTRRGWGLIYAFALVVGTVAMYRHEPGYLVLGTLAAFTIGLSLVGVLTRRQATDERAGRAARALLAGLLGASVGVLLVADASLGWGVHGLHPSIALVPSIVGSLWGGYHLWNFYDAVPQQLSGVPLASASRAAIRGPAMAIFIGAVLRLVGSTVVLSAVVVGLGRWTHGTDNLSVFVAFGAAALVSLLVGLLESLALQRAALVAAAAAVGAEIAWQQVIHSHLPGAGLAVGAAVGVLVAVPALVARLARSGSVLATMLWIQ
jgi:hypothetical protein